ncbi:hypothetical protein BSKO_00701 [Bryopsis sp. KO-2023]|nr:hypothetical protein BSKO_00701 [Bryopsis sp. KO-2023]
MERKPMAWDSQATFVVDPRLSAGRGAEFSAGAALHEDDEGVLGRGADLDRDAEPVGEEPASIHTPISEKNVGFQLLQKMGWKGTGTGLGRNEDGIVAPVKPYQEGGENTRLGVGKLEQDEEYTNADNVCRKKLEVEIQADEDEERSKRREIQVMREQRIKEDVQAAKQKFYCQICHKQYQTIMEWEAHLSSYDHHHKKRLNEMKAMVSGRSKRERKKREQKQLDKEMANLAQQSERARRQTEEPVSTAKSAPRPPQPDLPTERNAIQFGFGGGSVKSGGGGFSMKTSSSANKRPHAGGMQATQAKKAQKKVAQNLAAFGSDSESE